MSTKHRHLPKFDEGAHFITFRTYDGAGYLANPVCAGLFCETLEAERARLGIDVIGFVVMPNHVHLLLWLNNAATTDARSPLVHTPVSISKVMWAIKGKSARRIIDVLKQRGEADDDARAGDDAWVGGGIRVGDGNAVAGHGVAGHGIPALDVSGDGIAVAYPRVLAPAREPRDAPHYRQWRYKLWQPGAGYDFNVYTARKLREKLNYMHANPVRAGLARSPEAYVWSSAADHLGLPARHGVTVAARG
jgi:REP element-mobilizing transposase RayT